MVGQLDVTIQRMGRRCRDESIKAAQLLFQEGHYDFAAARAYYVAFYAPTAALLGETREFKNKAASLPKSIKIFVKTGKLKKYQGKNLNWLFELRSIGDYGDTRHVPE